MPNAATSGVPNAMGRLPLPAPLVPGCCASLAECGGDGDCVSPPQEEIRPTPDRVRETLFNWVGSAGARGALSGPVCGQWRVGARGAVARRGPGDFRGAGCDCGSGVARALTEWRAVGGQVEHSEALRFLGNTPQTFEIVFLDPPFTAGLLTPVAGLLEEKHWLSAKCADLCRNGRAQRPAATARNLACNQDQAGRGGGVSFTDTST